MDNNDSNIKSQQTGGLKLMTVFIAVLALHVVVIGGFTVYHLMSGGSSDTDLTTTSDKNHKSSAIDNATTDATAMTSTAATTTAPAEIATIPATPTSMPASAPAPTGDTVSPNVASNSAPAPTRIASTTVAPTPAPAPISTPALTLAQSTAAPAPAVVNPTSQTPSGPIASSQLAPPPEPAPFVAPAPAPMAPVVTPSTSLAAGPVHMPPANKDASRVAHVKEQKEHEQVYTVKITDSYKKIAKAHHVTVAQLKEANGIKGDTLHTGQKLFIPATGKSEVAETSALASTPTVLNTSTTPMTTGLSSTSTSAATTSGHHLYTIEKGDTLTKIAHKFKTTPSALMAANSDLDPTKLKIGKKLRIPSKESRSASITAPVNTTPVNTVPVAQPAQVQQAKSAVTTPTSGELTSFSL